MLHHPSVCAELHMHLQVLQLVWRCKCLQHPSVIPITGLAWSIPSMPDLPPTMPVLVMECEELGSLASVSVLVLLAVHGTYMCGLACPGHGV